MQATLALNKRNDLEKRFDNVEAEKAAVSAKVQDLQCELDEMRTTLDEVLPKFNEQKNALEELTKQAAAAKA